MALTPEQIAEITKKPVVRDAPHVMRDIVESYNAAHPPGEICPLQ